MKNYLIIFVAMLSLTACKDTESVERETQNSVAKADAECDASDTLRVQIGETVFAFPRGDIKNMSGPDVQWTGEPIYSKKVKAEQVCQKRSDAVLIFDRIHLNVIPTECRNNMSYGTCHRLSGHITRPQHNIKSQQEMRAIHIKKCQEKPYFNTCKHSVYYKDLGFYFHYYLTMYPLEDIEYTENLVLKYLSTHEINVRK